MIDIQHTDCPDGEGVDIFSLWKCRPCLEGMYASATDDQCLWCPPGYTNGVRGATDDSGCTSMYTF